MKIGIAGAGGIGSNVAMLLARSGVLAIRIVDFDRVEAANLDRQFYFTDQVGELKVAMLAANLRRIRPGIAVETIPARLDAGNCAAIFAGCQLVVEGLDLAEEKKMLLEALAKSSRTIVSACGIAGADLSGIRVRRIGNCHIVGDFRSDCARQPLHAHKVLAVACRMTEIILNNGGNHARP
ncbi:MAG: sulfur carrier protein ThiS adenylyltransferase ThiF [Leptonema illini]|uniref:Sulfur carrier protein ThiS adenylyltransferase ThiF n=1 Tax=Leptonema illini TaxID=183 RepID=A0A833LWE5_9LEPT|nr:MAG: sulfur carrier protein ThiS adenylyltransferase ThiF [Leptonema illini]